MKMMQAVVFAVLMAVGVVGCGGERAESCTDCTVDEPVHATTCPVGDYSCDPSGEPLEVKMPTSGNTTMTTAQVRTRLGGEGFSQENLSGVGTRRRWTYWAVRCADGISWCLSPTYDGTPYSITFQYDKLVSANVWQRLNVSVTNGTTSGADCYVYQSHVYEGQSSAGYLIGGALTVESASPPPPEAPTHIASAGTWVWPGTSVALKATCYAVGQPTVNRVERTVTATMSAPFTWNMTYRVSGGAGSLE